WIFPLPNKQANVGLGMRSDKISERKFNMKKSLLDILQNHPKLKERFKNAELIGDIKGFGLPLGSKKRIISGEHYMLVGDAGHLIDPLTGEGIGNALYSGVIAADQAMQCLKADNYSAQFMRGYDRRIQRVMGRELRISYLFQKIMFYPWIVRFMTRCVTNNSYVKNFLNKIYADSETEWHKEMKTMKFWYNFVFHKD
ncbi:MAG: geranylgeranyl reductase, partial [Bacteroidota bacterium]